MPRKVEDRLREEYFRLLPQAVKLAARLKTQVEYCLLPVTDKLAAHESLIVKARVKDCESAIDKLRRTAPGRIFDPNPSKEYSLLSLRDFVGVRVLTFPPQRIAEVNDLLRGEFPIWLPDPILDEDGERLGFKYNGTFQDSQILTEYQIVSSLIGLFWEIEHAAIYKQAPNVRGLAPLMRTQTSAVYRSLLAFETEFERQIEKSESGSSSADVYAGGES